MSKPYKASEAYDNVCYALWRESDEEACLASSTLSSSDEDDDVDAAKTVLYVVLAIVILIAVLVIVFGSVLYSKLSISVEKKNLNSIGDAL